MTGETSESKLTGKTKVSPDVGHKSDSSDQQKLPRIYSAQEKLRIAISIVILVSIAPLMVLLIGTAEIVNKLYLKLPISYFTSNINYVAKMVGDKILKDKRNYEYLPLMVLHGFWPLALFIWAALRYRANGVELWVVFVYHLLRIGPRFRFFAWFHVMIHKEGHDHNGFFNPPFSFLNHRWNAWYCSLFYGVLPNSYAVGHNKIHHRYVNGLNDAHTCYDLDRSDPVSFLIYIPRFVAYWTGISVVSYLIKTKEWVYAARMLSGMLYYVFVLYGAWRVAWDFTLCILIFPFLESVVFFAAISYLWHCFLDKDDPENEFINSITIVDGHDNVFNEDYHVAHHHAHTMHWTEYIKHFENNKEEFKLQNATIFRDCEEGLLLYWLFSQQWDVMANHWFDLTGKLTHQQKKDLILKRLRDTL